MSDPFVGEIKLFGFDFAPRGYAYCNGVTMQIRQYTVLFAILGIRFGGDGQNTFALPNLAGSVTMGAGAGRGLTRRQVGDTVGSAGVSLNLGQVPAHVHPLYGASLSAPNPAQNVATPTDAAMFGLSAPGPAYLPTAAVDTQMAPQAIGVSEGGNAPHENRQPFQAVNFVIALTGIYPSRN